MSAFAAEWVKVRTLRSTFLTLGATVAVGGALAFVVAAGMRNVEAAHFDAVFATFYSLTLAQLALVVFGVFTVGGEYAGGTIRPTLAAVPDRRRYYLAKVAVIGACAAVTSALTVGVAFAVGSVELGARRMGPTPAPIAGAFLYLLLITLFAAGVAQLLRGSTAALAVLMPLFFLGSQGLGNVPGVRAVAQFLPDQAGLVVLRLYDRDFGPWGGLGILALWTAAALVGGYLTLRRRDA
ncbi:ABC transporter permease [Dactylosporangium vinaceum]|uniref:ABC transporter permease n=1 Tax=Dactylosporangium vinaceum TaxID=53362 RepID=A0ABV5M4S8_9ACTN|nr:ABC transporter permease [Dactylosporangium vinaceum]UAB96076.1 ABC transporter permease [Dactylosporangium vinaceum]